MTLVTKSMSKNQENWRINLSPLSAQNRPKKYVERSANKVDSKREHTDALRTEFVEISILGYLLMHNGR